MDEKAYLDYEGLQKVIAHLDVKFADILAQIGAMDAIPGGAILAWSGSVDNIPSGWLLCDGTNSTPDLRGRFILGASDAHAVGEKGGEENHTLSVAEMPAHTHTAAGVNLTEDGNGGSLFTGGEDTMSPSDSAETSSTGGGDAFSIMPPYYALCYIMKATASEGT